MSIDQKITIFLTSALNISLVNITRNFIHSRSNSEAINIFDRKNVDRVVSSSSILRWAP